ncbi:hypothetical protein BACCIP111895_03755 [Neobacillus rhizosphaerae]|uniref:DUF5658 domain-containing protein n=1 Tax=Neobacillus rhizosphaerae TaxID=2880965 RepID=A0ABM9EV57_9BACI|nr:hypothetical protein BACCIP111895_03755 [Neobacillus rhizosphaerae]
MKKTLNVIVLLFLSAISYINYRFLIILFSTHFVHGDKLIHGLDATRKWVNIVEPTITIILSILTGVFFYYLHKKKLKKTKIAFSLLQILLFIYCFYKIIEILSDHNPIPIYR